MKTSQIKALIKKRATASLEQGDISIVVNQDGASTDGVDVNASEPMSLTEPDLSIADQPEVDAVVGASETADASQLDEGNIDGDIQDTDTSIGEGEEAIEALESYLTHVRTLKASGMPISAATVESLHLGVSAALGRWNTSAAEIGIPSQESVAVNQVASLEAMEAELVATMESLGEKVEELVGQHGEQVGNLLGGVKTSLGKQVARLDAAIASAKRLGDKSAIGNVNSGAAITLGAKSSADALKGIVAISDTVSDIISAKLAAAGSAGSEDETVAALLGNDSAKRFWSSYATTQKGNSLGGDAVHKAIAATAVDVNGDVVAIDPQDVVEAAEKLKSAIESVVAANGDFAGEGEPSHGFQSVQATSFKAIRDVVEGAVDYIVESVKLAESAGSAEAA